jgi:hypothetical protein
MDPSYTCMYEHVKYMFILAPEGQEDIRRQQLHHNEVSCQDCEQGIVMCMYEHVT